MRRNAGFTLIEMAISVTLFTVGAVFVFSTMSGVTRSSQNVTVEIDLGSQNKRAITRLYNELQASSLTAQDTDGLDATDPVPVLEVLDDAAAPAPHTAAKVVNRTGGADQQNGIWHVGSGKEQARERVITQSKRIRFRKVVGYQFNAGAGTIVPEWSNWVTYFVNNNNNLVRQVEGGQARVVANRVDALDAVANADGTMVVTLITARPTPSGDGWRRYANAVTIHPKN